MFFFKVPLDLEEYFILNYPLVSTVKLLEVYAKKGKSNFLHVKIGGESLTYFSCWLKYIPG